MVITIVADVLEMTSKSLKGGMGEWVMGNGEIRDQKKNGNYPEYIHIHG